MAHAESGLWNHFVWPTGSPMGYWKLGVMAGHKIKGPWTSMDMTICSSPLDPCCCLHVALCCLLAPDLCCCPNVTPLQLLLALWMWPEELLQFGSGPTVWAQFIQLPLYWAQ